MPGRTPLRATVLLIVVVYLIAAGWFLVLAPWSRFWAVKVVPAAPFWLMNWIDDPILRGALSGFGVVHFAAAWGWLDRATRKA